MKTDAETVANQVRAVLKDVLALSEDLAISLSDKTPLFGYLPELDSLAATNLLAEMEDRFSIRVDEEDLQADVFATFGDLCAFLAKKLHP